MEKFLLIVCIVMLPIIVQGLPTKHQGTDIIVKKIIDRFIQQQGNEDPKRNIYTALGKEITNVDDKGGIDIFINGIQAFIKSKRLGHKGSGIVKRSSFEDLHARGTSTTPKPTTTPSESSSSSVVTTLSPAAATTVPATTIPVTTRLPTTTTPATTTTEIIPDYPLYIACMFGGCFDDSLLKDYFIYL